LALLFVFVVGFLQATCGYTLEVINIVQMCGGLINPGIPVANMYFTLFGNNSVKQATAMLLDLKVGQYMKIPPKAVFFCQLYGAVIGSICNYFMTTSIIANNREVLLDPHGTYQWSGYMVQNFNSLSITWGALPYKLYAPGQKYFVIALGLPIGIFLPIPFWALHKKFPKAGFNYINWGVLGSCFAYLSMGINSHMLTMFFVGFISQYWMRRNRPMWFKNYNYIISAGLDAGTQVAILLINVTVLGAINTIPFPNYVLNPLGNPDYCP
jgi:OPT family oligopeptide transporter